MTTAPTALLDRVHLSIRPPGATEWTRFSNNPATRDERALPIQDVTAQWTRNSPRGHLEPAELSLTLRVPDGSPDADAIVYNAELDLIAYTTPEQAIYTRLFIGWITQWESGAPVDGFRYYTVNAIDFLGRLAETRFGAIYGTTWPEESLGTRVNRLRAFIPSGTFLGAGDAPTTATVLARRIERDRSATVLDVLRLTAPLGWTVHAPGYQATPVAPGTYTPTAAQPLHLPAGAIEDTGRAQSRRGLLTNVTITGKPVIVGDEGAEPQTYEYPLTPPTNPAYGTASTGYDTDVRFDSNAARDWANAQITTDDPATILRGMPRIVTARLDDATLNALISSNGRTRLAFYIPEAPLELDTLQIVTGATITITGRRVGLAVELHPGRLYGLRRLTFDDARLKRTIFPARPRLTAQHTSGRPMRIADIAHSDIRPPAA